MANPFVNLTADDFTQALRKLLPPGTVYAAARSQPLQLAMVAGLAAQEFALHARSVDLLEVESDPAYTLELLPDWEAEYGLPDPCTPLAPTIGQRRIALLGKIASVGGQSDGYLIAVAAAMGFVITITHLRAAKFGVSKFGDAWNGPVCDFVMLITTTDVRLIRAKFGAAQFGDPFDLIDNTQLECRLRAIAPADFYLLFSYAS